MSIPRNVSFYFETLIFIIILEISLLIRLHQYYSISYFDESGRDYLIAHHIVKYHEFPLVGPPDEGRYIFRNGPIYHYFLAVQLLIKDDPFFLGISNVLLQMINIGIIYFIAKRLFGSIPALLASTVFAVGDYFLSQSAYIHQPNIMQPFANLSYLLLVIGYKKRQYFFLLASVTILLIAASLHRSAVVQIPLMLGLIFVILRSWRVGLKKYLLIAGTTITILYLLYLPVLVSTSRLVDDDPISHTQSYLSGLEFFYAFRENISIFLKHIFVGEKIFNPHISYLIPIFIATSFIYFFIRRFHKFGTKVNLHKELIYLFIISAAIFLQFTIAVLLGFTQIRYFTPILGVFIILISVVIIKVGSLGHFCKLLALVLTGFIVYSTSPNLYNNIYSSLTDNHLVPQGFHPAFSIQDKIVEIKEKERRKDFNFFRIITYRSNHIYDVINASFLVPMEKKLNKKFTKIDENFLNNFTQINDEDYYFVICYEYENLTDAETNCLKKFILERQQYAIDSLVYNGKEAGKSFIVYLANKKHD